uniref:Uncharacterized protein n=1 Tax=Oryza glumipatula TaxID=40148 RepID=A0A0D9Y994_9ORYZ
MDRPETEVQLVSYVQHDPEDTTGMEWEEIELDVYEDQSPTKEDIDAPKDDDNSNNKSKVPSVLRSHNSQCVQQLQSKRRGRTGKEGECHKEPKGCVLCGYYTCVFLRVNRDLYHFIYHECYHKDGLFFNLEGSLAISEESKFLGEWSHVLV